MYKCLLSKATTSCLLHLDLCGSGGDKAPADPAARGGPDLHGGPQLAQSWAVSYTHLDVYKRQHTHTHTHTHTHILFIFT